MELHPDDAVLRFGDEEIRGSKAIAAEEWAHFEAFPDLTLTPNDVLADGERERVVVRLTAVGTHEGEFNGIEPTGATVDYSLMGMFRVADGAVEEVWMVADRLEMMQQLGVIDTLAE